MAEIQIKNISGFLGSDVEVYHNGKLFYLNDSGENIEFNLPCGSFEIEGKNIECLERPLLYKTPKISIPQKNIKMKEMVIHFVDNPNKASIHVQSGNTYFDSELAEMWETPKKIFVLGHELGHNFYKDEILCDIYSAKKMLENGFNPSQCIYSSVTCLSKGAEERKNKLLNFLKKVTYERN